jgi:hypothetical protein
MPGFQEISLLSRLPPLELGNLPSFFSWDSAEILRVPFSPPPPPPRHPRFSRTALCIFKL